MEALELQVGKMGPSTTLVLKTRIYKNRFAVWSAKKIKRYGNTLNLVLRYQNSYIHYVVLVAYAAILQPGLAHRNVVC